MHDALAQVLRSCGFKAQSDPTKSHGVELIVDRHPVMAAVKAVTNDERVEKFPGALVQAMLRVDMVACKRLRLEQGRDLDRWIMRYEDHFGVLVANVAGLPPPFPGKRLALQSVTPGDSWSLHLSTSKDGRWRSSLVLVMEN